MATVRSLAVLSMHTSPLAQPGTGDGGGMNVYVRELSTALARAGVRCEVFTRAERSLRPEVVDVEPGFRVHHVTAGPRRPGGKEALPGLVDEFTDGGGGALAPSWRPAVIKWTPSTPTTGCRASPATA